MAENGLAMSRGTGLMYRYIAGPPSREMAGMFRELNVEIFDTVLSGTETALEPRDPLAIIAPHSGESRDEIHSR